MSLFATLFTAAAEGVKAKAEHEANKRARKNAGKNEADCTPCAANARVEAYREAAQSNVPKRGRR